MSAVNLWKPQKLQSRMRLTELGCEWRFVRIAENRAPTGESVGKFRIWSTPINIFSAPFSSLVHRTWARHREQIFGKSRNHGAQHSQKESVQHRGRSGLRFGIRREGKVSGLLQCVHQPRDRAVQVFVRPPQLFDLVDRVQHRGVVLAAELAADLRK